MTTDIVYENEYHRKSFLERYSLFSKLLVIFVFVDFLFRRLALSSGVLIFNNVFSVLINVNYFIIFSVLFAIVFYRFYNSFFYKDIFTAIVGCTSIFISTALIFLRQDNYLFEILSIIFILLLIIIFCKTIIPLIKRKSITEKERFLFIFIFLYLVSSAFRFLAASSSYIVFKIFLNMYFLYDIHTYFIKLSSYSFIIFSFIYFYMFFNTLSRKRIIATLLSVILISSLFILLKGSLSALFIYSLEALKIEITISPYINIIFIILLLITSFSNIFYTNKNSLIIYLFFLSIAGINIMDLFNLLLILFILTDIKNTKDNLI